MYRSYARLILDIWPSLVLGGVQSKEAAATELQISRIHTAPAPSLPFAARTRDKQILPSLATDPGLTNLQDRGADGR
jgi:hypothetical protein